MSLCNGYMKDLRGKTKVCKLILSCPYLQFTLFEGLFCVCRRKCHCKMLCHIKGCVHSLELSEHEAVNIESLNVYSSKYFSFLQPHRLAHEIGAGAPCLTCGDTCPGLDLHFWRYAANK